ncbi:MAG: prepilin-type N-terminal cleavage/methylation domain-containing protein [Rubrivivax sp.]|nr:prepilin-type N-terminal cleavage/methylation domain-containing protein [Rubrivivax sp.]
MRQAFQRGFTLIELMIVVVVVALLAALALPSFLDSVRKGRRSTAFEAVSQIQQAQERWRANNASFAGGIASSGGRFTGLTASGATSYTTANGYYEISVSGASATGYTILATAKGSQANDTACRLMQVQMTGGNLVYAAGSSTLSTAAADVSRCWRS